MDFGFKGIFKFNLGLMAQYHNVGILFKKYLINY